MYPPNHHVTVTAPPHEIKISSRVSSRGILASKTAKMNEFLKYEVISQVSLSDDDKKQRGGGRQKRPPCHEINIDEELDKLFPPKSVTDEGEVKTIRVSRKQANLFDIHKLNDDLDDAINTTMENEQTGFSEKFMAVHTGMFDELTRQEMIACPERGLMMVTVRDEVIINESYNPKLISEI